MLKLREPFSKKVHLHIRQDMLQRLWDKYVPASSPEYEQIQLIYLDGKTGERGRRPEQVQLLLNLVLRNQRMQLRLGQSPAPVKFVPKQMESSLKRMERHYMIQLKSCDFAVYRKVKQYFALLWQAEKGELRYRSWQKDCQAIEKQREEYRLLSLFSVRLREYSAEYSVRAMRTLEKELLRFLSEKEYRTLAEDIIWQEKQEFLAYLGECDEAKCRKMVRQLEKEKSIRQVFYAVRKHSAQEKLVEAVTKMGQKEFCFVYHQAAKWTDIVQQKEIWKKSRTEMLRFLEQATPEVLQKVWLQLEKSALQEEKSAVQEEKSALQTEKSAVQKEKSVLQEEKSAVQEEKSALQEEKSAVQTKKSALQAEKSAVQAESKKVFSEKMKLLREQYRKEEFKSLQDRAAVMLENNTFQKIADIVDIGQLVKEFNAAEPGDFQAHRTAEPGDFQAHRAAESGDFQAHRAAELWDFQAHRAAEPEEQPTYRVIEQAAQRKGCIGEHTDHFSRDGVSYVFHRLDQEREIRRERIERYQAQAVETYREFYQQVLPEDWQVQEQADKHAERTFLSRHRQGVTKEEVWNIRRWSRMLLESFLVKQKQEQRDAEISEKELYTEQKERENQAEAAEQEFRTGMEETAFSADRKYKLELIHMMKQINRYMEEQNTSEEKVILNWRENLPKDPQIQRLLVYIQELKKTQRTEFIKYLADMILILQEENQNHNVEERKSENIMLQYEKAESSDSVLQVKEKELLLPGNDKMPGISRRKLWEWGEVLLSHPEYEQEWQDADILSGRQQEVIFSEEDGQENLQTQVIRRQIEMAKDRNHLQRLVRQINHRTDAGLVYADVQLSMPQVQELLNDVRQLDETQYGILVKELSEVIKMQKLLDAGQEPAELVQKDVKEEKQLSVAAAKSLEHRKGKGYQAVSYTVLAQHIQQFETQRRLAVRRELRKMEQTLGLPAFREEDARNLMKEEASRDSGGIERYENYNRDSGGIEGYENYNRDSGGIEGYENYNRDSGGIEGYENYNRDSGGIEGYENYNRDSGGIEGYENYNKEYFYTLEGNYMAGYFPASKDYRIQELEYSKQKTGALEEEQQRTRIRMEEENAQIRSAQEQLDMKLKEVEQQLKKTEGAPQASEDVRTLAEQVKRQLYEELHVEKLRRGLV